VIATSSSGAKLARARGLGADATFDHNADDVVAGVPRRPDRAAYPERVYCFF
jgi:NADPH:quinone reductase-like Zn-dependent oxidoreductase